MNTYITLYNWTQQGINNIEESPNRYDDAVELAESMGGEIKEAYITFGQFDVVLISEWPDDETYVQFALTLASFGNVVGETLKALPQEDYRDLMTELPK